MKKLFFSVIALAMGLTTISADDATTPFIFSTIGDNTYAVTMSQEDMQAKFPKDWQGDAVWNMGIGFPDGTTLLENDDFKAVSKLTLCCFWTGNNFEQMQKENDKVTGYLNLGSNLPQNNWTEESFQIIDIADLAAGKNHGLILFTPKKSGKLSYHVFAGGKTRSIGIYKLATEAEMENEDFGKLIAFENFRHEDKAPADVEADVEADRDYLFVAGNPANIGLANFKFVPAGGSETAISGVAGKAAKTVAAIFSADGTQLNAMKSGLNIVKYSDGTSVKIVK